VPVRCGAIKMEIAVKDGQVKGPYLKVTGVDADEMEIEAFFTAETDTELRQQLVRFLESAEPLSAIYFSSSLDLARERTLAEWAARQDPLPSPWVDDGLDDCMIGEQEYVRWEDRESSLWIDPAVGEAAGQMIVIDGRGYFAIRRADIDDTVLWTPDADVDAVLLRESWRTLYGWSARKFSLRHDGLLETSCYSSEGPPPEFELLPADADEVALIRRVIEYNRSGGGGFDNSGLVDVAAFEALFSAYLRSGTPEQHGWIEGEYSTEIRGEYQLSASQREIAFEILEADTRNS